MNSILMIFIDGIGIGKEDYEFNPFFKYGFRTFTEIFNQIPSTANPSLKGGKKNNTFLFPADAKLGVKGLPQSGTGQTSIFCGINAARKVGKHFGPYPYSTLIPIIREKNIFKHYLSKKEKAFFANAYPEVFFEYLKSGNARLSVTSLSCKLNEMRLNSITDLRKRKALTAEITNARWNKKLGYKLPAIKPESAARRLLKIASENRFTLYEYFLTDHMGHGRYDEDVESTLDVLDKFLLTILKEMDESKLTLIVCSDHGNFEDLSVRTHTLNPALIITSGKYSDKLSASIKKISEIKKAIIRYCK